jgi:hypothetical protein
MKLSNQPIIAFKGRSVKPTLQLVFGRWLVARIWLGQPCGRQCRFDRQQRGRRPRGFLEEVKVIQG